jgi:enoyl-CoA hydratase
MSPTTDPSSEVSGGDAVVLTEQRGAVRIVTLNRPHVLNALDTALELALWAALDAADRDPETRAVVLRGAGRAFSAGADLKERALDGIVDVDAVVREFRAHSVFMRLLDMETPVVAAVHGYCLGGALQIAGLCDLTILGASAQLGEPEVRFANPLLVPITPHLIGLKHARRLLYQGTMIDAPTAVRIGLASEVVADDILEERAVAVATDIAQVPVEAVRTASRASRRATETIGMEQMAIINAEILALTLRAQQTEPEGAGFLEAVRSSGAGTAASGVTGPPTEDPNPGAAMTNEPGIEGTEYVRVARVGPASVITLDRPLVLNALNRQLLAEFDAAFAAALADQGSRVIVVRAEGRAFSAGMDLKEPDQLPLPADGQRTQLAGLLDRVMRIWDSDKPVIAAVQGHCLGHACDIAVAADITIAGASAQFGVPEVRHLGGVAAMLYPYLMPHKRMRDFLYRGRSLDATSAEAAGLATLVVPDDELTSTALSMAEELARIPPAGLRQMKRAINRSIDGMGLRGTLAYNLESLALILNAQPSDALAAREAQIRDGGLRSFIEERDR